MDQEFFASNRKKTMKYALPYLLLPIVATVAFIVGAGHTEPVSKGNLLHAPFDAGAVIRTAPLYYVVDAKTGSTYRLSGLDERGQAHTLQLVDYNRQNIGDEQPVQIVP